MPTWSFPQGSKPSKHKVTSILKPGKWVSMLPRQYKHTQASEPGLSPALTSLRAPQHVAAWLRAWVSTGHTSFQRHACFSCIPVACGSPAPPGEGPGAELLHPGPAAPLASSLSPSPLSQQLPCNSLAPRANSPSPRSRSGGSPDLFFQPTPLWHLWDLGAVWPGAFPLHRASRALECG